jgi:hypothetical protein
MTFKINFLQNEVVFLSKNPTLFKSLIITVSTPIIKSYSILIPSVQKFKTLQARYKNNFESKQNRSIFSTSL